MPVVTVHM
jgi:4-oxalocrotonate tautomerase